jgi:hypothetical protein
VLELGVTPNPGAGPAPLHGGVASTWVSTMGLVLVAFMILSFYCTHDLVQGLRDGCGERERCAAEQAAKWRGVVTP